jgi:O-antigen ligase
LKLVLLDKYFRLFSRDVVVRLPLILLFVSLFYVRSLVSISIGLMGLVALWLTIKNGFLFKDLISGQKQIFIALLALFTLVILQVFKMGVSYFWLNELLTKLPLIIIPWYILTIGLSMRHDEKYLLLLFSVVILTAILSVGNYAMNYTEINLLLLQSKHVPVAGGSHHIYFGIFMTLCFWLGVYYVYFGQYRKVWLLGAVMLLFCMHVLVSRTGLLAFYLSAICFAGWLIWRYRKDRRVLWLTIVTLLLPILAFQFSGSLQNKVTNSLEDLKAVRSGEDINYKSLAMRMEAWKTTFDIIKQHPVLGTGSKNFEEEMQEQYSLNRTPLLLENRIGPHNQFLESGAKYGIVSILLLLIIFIVSVMNWRGNSFLMLVTIVFLFVIQFESLLERQLGMVAFTLFYMLSFTASGVSEVKQMPKEL